MTEIAHHKQEKAIVLVSEEGHILLENIFPNKDTSKIELYQIKKMPDGTIIIRFYDKNNTLIRDL